MNSESERGLEYPKMKTIEYYMRQVFALAGEALEREELPIAAIVVLDDRIISKAATSEKHEKRFLGHAELVALEVADRQKSYLRSANQGEAIYQPGTMFDVHGSGHVIFLG